MFSDECDLFAEVTQKIVTRKRPDQHVALPSEGNYRRTKIKVWDMISLNGSFVIKKYEGNITGEMYSQLLEVVLFPYVDVFSKNTLILLKNNPKSHISLIATNRLNELGINF